MRTTWGCVLLVKVLITQNALTLSAQLTKPINTVSLWGDMVKMECSSNSSMPPVDWEFAVTSSSNASYIYTVGRVTVGLSSRYKIDTDNITRYDIAIESVDRSHAGTYICTPVTEEVVNISSYSAELIVLGADPVCDTNASESNAGVVEGDYILMWCTVNCTGNWIPVMEWTRRDGQTILANVTYTNTLTKVTSSLIIQFSSSDNKVTFTCKTTFTTQSTKTSMIRRRGEIATNVPDYQHHWNFNANVLYAPRNNTVMYQDMSWVMKSVYEVGDRLVCWANGNPTPTYEWLEIETNRTIHGSILTIEDHMTSGENHSFRCSAFNSVAGIGRPITETVTFKIRGKRELSGVTDGRSRIPTEHSIIISIITVGAVCCLVLTLYLCNNRCPYKRGMVESLDNNPTDRLRSVEAVHSSVFQGGNSQQQHPLPVYSEVRRKENIAEGATGYLPKQKGLPVYTPVMKNRNGSKHPDWLGQTAESTASQHRSPKTHPGADGTQYMNVTSMRDLNARAPIRNPPMFSLVETYASIDHTVDASPPPRPPKRQ